MIEMTEREFARRVFWCVKNGERGAPDLLLRCRREVAALEVANDVKEEEASFVEYLQVLSLQLVSRVDALAVRVVNLESVRDMQETHEAEHRDRTAVASPSPYDLGATSHPR